MSVSKDMVPQYLWSNQGVGVGIGCSSANCAVSSKSWCEKLFKPLFRSPNIGGAMRVPQYLRRRSKEVGECSSANYATHLPLFLNNKRIFIIAIVSCSLHSWSLWIAHHQEQFNGREYLDGNKELQCVVYEQPNEMKEVEVLIELYSLILKEVENKLSIETRIVYEDEGELYFFPINPKKELLHNPNHQQFRMWVSNDMVSKDLCSNEVVGGCSSNYSLPLFLKKKGIFIGVNVYGRIDSQHEINGRTELIAPHNDLSLECRVYDVLTEPNKFREVEELIEFYSSPVKTRELSSLLQTYVAYEEDDGGVYFIPINPKVVMEFEAECRDGEGREQQNEEGSSSSI
nr:disease resistance protein TAO1-like [Ipomoea trifida]